MVKMEQTVSNRLSREKGTGDTYNKLMECSGPLNKKNKIYSRDIFSLALAYGYSNNIKFPIETKDNFLNMENFGKNLLSLIDALAISKSDEGVHILAEDNSEVYVFAEEYANGGLELLNSDYIGHEDEFIEKLRLRILKLNKNDELLNKIKELGL